jgi:hypothetical protein
VIDWRFGLLARLGAAAVVGGLTGGAALLAGHLMPLAPVPVDCRPAGGIGCGIAGPIGGLLLGLLLWLVVVLVVALVVGSLLSWFSGMLLGVRLGLVVPLAWPFVLWGIALLLRPLGVTLYLKGMGLVGYVALAFAVAALLTAPQLWRGARARVLSHRD